MSTTEIWLYILALRAKALRLRSMNALKIPCELHGAVCGQFVNTRTLSEDLIQKRLRISDITEGAGRQCGDDFYTAKFLQKSGWQD